MDLSSKVKQAIRDIPDYPKKGIIFKDITTLLNNPKPFGLLMDHLVSKYKSYNLDYIVALDARGFIFGSILANRLNIGFVPVRKKGKLPSETICEDYELEYGTNSVEIHKDAFVKPNSDVLIIDDLCATGGTAQAACKLVEQTDANIKEICFILNLKFLNGDEKLKQYAPVYSVLDI